MEYDIRHRPAYALLDISLDPGEQVTAEAGAMVSHSAGIDIETKKGSDSIFQSLKTSVLGGESFFRNTFSAPDGGSVTLAPPLPGDIVPYELVGETVYVQSGSYLAADSEMEIDTALGGTKSFFGGEGLFLLKLTGSGPAYFASYGAVESIDLDAGESHIVDTGHIVAFTDETEWSVRKVGGLKSTLLSGEGLVCEFTGPGTVWLQTRSQDAFLSWLIPQLPTQNSSA